MNEENWNKAAGAQSRAGEAGANLTDELDAYKRDAERYRWLRDAGATFYTGVDTPLEKKHHVCEWAMDAAIDAAMAANMLGEALPNYKGETKL